MEKTTEKSNHQNCHTWVIQTRHIISIMGMFGNIVVLAKLTYSIAWMMRTNPKKKNELWDRSCEGKEGEDVHHQQI